MTRKEKWKRSRGVSRLKLSLCPSSLPQHPSCGISMLLKAKAVTVLAREMPSLSVTGTPGLSVSSASRLQTSNKSNPSSTTHTAECTVCVFWQTWMMGWQGGMDLTRMRLLLTCRGCSEAVLCCKEELRVEEEEYEDDVSVWESTLNDHRLSFLIL